MGKRGDSVQSETNKKQTKQSNNIINKIMMNGINENYGETRKKQNNKTTILIKL